MFRRSPSHPSFLERRRARQRGGDAKRAYTFELAALHLELLVAMAAVDEEVRTIEVEEVLGFLDRARLGTDDQVKLDELARTAVAAPPDLNRLMGRLGKFAQKPALATLLVTDLSRVAAADARADPREVALLDHVCDALQVERVTIRIDAAPVGDGAGAGGGTRPPAGERQPRLVAQHRVRSQVRRALEQTYADRDASNG